ncbi:carboxynorspermidine decarboxylase [Geovibrio ferrireducens]|uniref:carboxynorspermidine decarboxylase n=1 Tax=Geovibrio ferrireducens TaxID=46201 RepID=UPI0022465271|nr:carboxynorspermidine decarboxylase [Geovibrio ferrireducens]
MKNIYAQALKDFPKEITDRAETPCYLISEDVIRRNCETLDSVQKRTGAKIMLALKAFALPKVFPLISSYLHGVCASGPIEAQLGSEEFKRETHTYSPAFTDAQMERTVKYSDHIVFNSVSQWHLHRDRIKNSGKHIEIGLRVNPGHAEVEVDLYNPCLPGSRFGVSPQDLEGVDLTEIDGLHFHAMCEQNSDVLERVLASFEKRFAHLIPQMKWINFGGGHHITRDDYDIELLCRLITDFRKRYNNIQVYLEPGEAVVLNAGVFITSVLDTIYNGMDIAVCDCSAETHMPDVLAMPYRPKLIGEPENGKYTYRLGGISCLSGDFIGDYRFDTPLKRGDRLVFTDMALYSFVKNTNFNGVELPSLITFSLEKGTFEVVRKFGYEDYKNRIS